MKEKPAKQTNKKQHKKAKQRITSERAKICVEFNAYGSETKCIWQGSERKCKPNKKKQIKMR